MKTLLTAWLTFLASVMHAGQWVDISINNNLSDEGDDAAGLRTAIQAAGEGGVVYIPAGTVVLKSSVVISNQSLTILGNGVDSVMIESKLPSRQGCQAAALEFVATTTACKWKLRGLNFTSDAAFPGGAIRVKDTRGVSGGSSMDIRFVNITSGITTFYEFGIEIDGMASVYMQRMIMQGELRTNPGEPPAPRGLLTLSHIRLRGLPSGTIDLDDAHMRMAQQCIDIGADYDTLNLEVPGRVQSIYGVYQSPHVQGRRFILKGGGSQEDNALTVSATELIHISRARFARKTPGPDIELRGQKTAAIHMVGNLAKAGYLLDDCQNGLFFENHLSGGAITLKNTSHVVNCNNMGSTGDAYQDVVIVKGNSTDISVSQMEPIR